MTALEENIALNTSNSCLVYPPPKKKKKGMFKMMSMPGSSPKKAKQEGGEPPEMIGNTIDGALLWMLTKCMKYEKDYYVKIRNAAAGDGSGAALGYGVTVVKRVLFSSRTRRSAVLVRYNQNGVHRLYIKGGGEIIVDSCEFYWDNKGEPEAMDDAKKEYFKAQLVGRMGRGSYSPIGLAHVDFDGKTNSLPEGDLADVVTEEWVLARVWARGRV